MTATIKEEQFAGAMVGLAVSDALGYPTEFISRAQILERFGPAGVTDFVPGHGHPSGTYTDDTQMSLAVAHGLLDARDQNIDELLRCVCARFVTWSRSPDNDRAPGGACMRGCANLAAGVPWREAGVPGSKGCGTAMRVAPVGLRYHQDLERLLEVARATALPTHGHPAGQEGAAAAALMVALALRGADGPTLHAEIMRRCAGRSDDFDACLSRVPAAVEDPPEMALSRAGLGEAWVAEEAVASALYCVWRHPDDYRAAALEAINTDGDSDSIGAIAGSILGARLGLDGIPAAWAQGVEDADLLQATGRALWRAARAD